MNINQNKISTDQHFILCSGKWKHVLVGLSWFECNAESTTMVLIKGPAVFLLTVNILGVLCPGNPGEHPEEQADLH